MGCFNWILGILSGIYMFLPNSGLIELSPDALPFVGHVDELAATYFLSTLMGVKGTANPTKWQSLGMGALGLLSLLYLFFPTLGIAELISDFIPVVGNIDELVAGLALVSSAKTILNK